MPAYQTPGSLAWPGVSQKTLATDRLGATAMTWSGRSSLNGSWPSGRVPSGRGKRGGSSASVQVRPASAER